ncbi:MAG: nickel-dependent hydrogenase large subunit [Candidatus Aquicultor sp.]
MAKVVIDPITRIEGHLRITCIVENGKVTDAWNTCTLFRGFEIFMKNRDPMGIWHFAQRICGVCPTPHALNSVQAVERAMGIEKVDDNARLVRNMMEASQIGYDHILWFYILNAFDYVNVPNALNARPTTQALKDVQDKVNAVVQSGQLGPFANMFWDHPGYKLSPDLDLELTAHYLQSIDAQQAANDAAAFMGGKYPMIMNYVPGGVTQLPSIEEILFYRGRMEQVQAFVNEVMVPDLLAIAPFYLDLAKTGKGHANYLTWGVLDEKSQDPGDRVFPRGGIFDGKLQLEKVDPDKSRMYTKFSWFDDKVGGGKHPLDSGQEPINYTGIDPLDNQEPVKGKYDWTQAVRYGDDNKPMEVGPLAQMLVGYLAGRPEIKKAVDDTLKAIGQPGNVGILMSDLGRIAARVLKAKVNADNALRWSDELLDNIKGGKTQVFKAKPIPATGTGKGGWDAPRGALCHYIKIKNGLIDTYAAVPPSNWNLSPRDDNGVRGPVEEALVGQPVVDPTKPLEILRVVHTFDP